MELFEKSGEFKISAGGKVLIQHSAENPCVYVGKGSADYQMNLGNFKITDTLHEKLALRDFKITMDPKGFTINFVQNGMFPLTARVETVDGRETVTFKSDDPNINRIWVRLYAESGEHVYGCGEQFSNFDLRGKNYPLWTSEQGVGRNKKTRITFEADVDNMGGGDYYTTFFPAPTFVSSRKYYCHAEESAYMDFDFRGDTFHELQIWGSSIKLIFETADTFTGLCEKLTSLLGRQPELPEWVYSGVILGIQNGTETCLQKLQKALDSGVKVSGIWAQDWEGQRITSFGKRLRWNWMWDEKLYPELDREVKRLKEQGVRFLGYINPYVLVEGSLYAEAAEKDFLAKNDAGENYHVDFGEFYAGVVDFTNPDACEWYKDVIKKNLIGFGLSGWMADFGEYLPIDIHLKNGQDAAVLHNQWPAAWAKINREAVDECGMRDEVTFFMRAGYTGSQKYCSLLWAGDQNVDWSLDDGLASVMPAALSAGMSGCGLHHSDIGGYTTLYGMKRTKELFMRWTEMAAFTVMMRTHEGNRPDDNWQFDSDEETLAHLARMTNVFATLAPYTKAAVKENAEKGIPVERPLFMHYEDDENAYTPQYQYLFGRDLLVAPVYEEGKRERKVYLPDDEWIHLWSGEKFGKGEFTVQSELGYPPVFYRASSKYADLFQKTAKL